MVLPIMLSLYFSYLKDNFTGLILGLHPANKRRHYNVTPSLIGWVQA